VTECVSEKYPLLKGVQERMYRMQTANPLFELGGLYIIVLSIRLMPCTFHAIYMFVKICRIYITRFYKKYVM